MTNSITRTRWWESVDLRETALLALTIVLGLQILRVLLTGLVFYLRDSLGAGSIMPGVYALAVFSLAFLAVPVRSHLGPRRTLVLTAGGLALVRFFEQLAPWPVVDLGLTTLGTVLFLVFIPTYIGHIRGSGGQGGHVFATGFLLGVGIDTAIKGAFATLDLSWQPGVVTYLIVIFLVGSQWLFLRAVVRSSGEEPPGGAGTLALTPLVALGPILFLEFLLFQNIGQQTALIGWNQPLVFLWIVLGNAVGIVAATIVMARPSYGRVASLLAFSALFGLLVLGERSGVAAAVVALFGQVAIAMSVGMVGSALVSAPKRTSLGTTAAFSGLGMLVLLTLIFLYYVNYQFDLPGGSAIVPLIAAAILILCIAGAMPFFTKYGLTYGPKYGVRAMNWSPALAAFLLLVIPLGYLAAWGKPQPVPPSGFPVRVMSYNLHQGFDVGGSMSIEDLAKAIEKQKPDIVALQEVSRGWVIDGSFDMLVWLSRRLDMPYVWGPAADSVWGNAILTRYPVSRSGTEPMPNNSQIPLKRSFTTALIDIGNGEMLTVIVTHLHNPPEEGHLREPQVRALLQAWNNNQRSVVIGDLNATPGDPETVLLSEAGLKDAFLAHGAFRPADEAKKMGYTTSRNPAKRIDYIWISGDLKASEFSLTNTLASDHQGVAVTLDR